MTLHVKQSRFLRYNAGAFVSAGEACLVDPGLTPDEISALDDVCQGSELRYVILTHADWDHVLGPEHLPPTTIVTHASYADDLDPHGIRMVLTRLEQRAGIAREHRFDPPLPDLVFESELTLEVGELELRLEHAPGHTMSMLTVYESSTATLWAADVLSDIEIPLIAADLDAYERTLERISSLDVARLVVGHGSPTEDRTEIRRRLAEDQAYLTELRTTVSTAVAAGSSITETVDLCASIMLRRSDEDDELHRLNVEKVYADLGGDADPETVGFARAWKEMTSR